MALNRYPVDIETRADEVVGPYGKDEGLYVDREKLEYFGRRAAVGGGPYGKDESLYVDREMLEYFGRRAAGSGPATFAKSRCDTGTVP